MLTSASNKQISDAAPSEYLTKVIIAAGDQLPKWLEANLIPFPAFEAALKDDYDSFLELRATHIHEAVLVKAGWLKSGGTTIGAESIAETDDLIE